MKKFKALTIVGLALANAGALNQLISFIYYSVLGSSQFLPWFLYSSAIAILDVYLVFSLKGKSIKPLLASTLFALSLRSIVNLVTSLIMYERYDIVIEATNLVFMVLRLFADIAVIVVGVFCIVGLRKASFILFLSSGSVKVILSIIPFLSILLEYTAKFNMSSEMFWQIIPSYTFSGLTTSLTFAAILLCLLALMVKTSPQSDDVLGTFDGEDRLPEL